LTLVLLWPAWAEVTVENLLIRRTRTEVNVRVSLLNTGPRPSPARMRLGLFIRPDARAPWEPFKVWFLGSIKPGQRVSRDYFFGANQRLKQLALDNPRFEVKAWLTVGEVDLEKTAVAGDADGPMTGASPEP